MRHSISCIGLLVVMSCMVTGCMSVGPDYTPPTAEVATQWLEFEDPRLQTELTRGPAVVEAGFSGPGARPVD